MRINIKHRSRVEFAQQEIQSIENEDLKRGTWRLKNGDRLKEKWTMNLFQRSRVGGGFLYHFNQWLGGRCRIGNLEEFKKGVFRLFFC